MKLREIYERALALINERNSEGAYHADIGDFEKNAPAVASTLIALYTTSDAVLKNEKIRDIGEIKAVESLDDELPFHPHLSAAVLPFALASMMILEEDSQRSEYFLSLARLAESKLLSAYARGESTSVKNVY